MKKRDKILEFVCQSWENYHSIADYKGITTTETAEQFHIYRNEASTILNQLLKDGLLEKTSSRPVYYYPSKHQRTLFVSETSHSSTEMPTENKSCLDEIIGADGSLKYQIELAKASIAYPPMGIHTLITGKSGTGKSMLAETMWKYAKEAFPEKKNIPFVTFSCAEYSDNPQLILEQLFGHAKGAYTGAAQDRMGLVEKANGGILFLDEIHRLPPTSQELLFILIDKGIYRRIGDSTDRKVSLQLIGATSEDISCSLLTTFRRRMPLTIAMPQLSERPLVEHFQLIQFFLQKECRKIKIPIHITGKALQCFLNYNGSANVGDLQNSLLVSCATAFLRTNARHLDKIIVDVYDIPQLVYITTKEIDTNYSNYIQEKIKSGITFYPEKLEDTKKEKNTNSPFDLYNFAKTQKNDEHITKNPFHSSADTQKSLEQYYDHNLQQLNNRRLLKDELPDVVLQAADYIIKEAYINKQRPYNHAIYSAIVLHLKQFYYLIRSNRILFNPELAHIQECYKTEISMVKELLPKLTEFFGVDILDDEIGYLAMLLSRTAAGPDKLQRKILLISFDNHIATDISIYAEKINALSCYESLIIPYDTPVNQITSIVSQKIHHMYDTKELLIFTDIYSLYRSHTQLSNLVSIPCFMIPVLSTMLVLEAGQELTYQNKALSSIVIELKQNYLKYIKTLFDPSYVKSTNHNFINPAIFQDHKIIIYSSTGKKTAKIIKNLLIENVPITNHLEIILANDKTTLMQVFKAHQNHIRLIVGNTNPMIENIPFIGLEELLYQEGIDKIRIFLQYDNILLNTPKDTSEMISRKQIDSLLFKKMNYFCPSFPDKKSFQLCTEIILALENNVFHCTFSPESYTRGFLHCACMIERLYTHQSFHFDTDEDSAHFQKNPLFQNGFNILCNILKKYDLSISSYEVQQLLDAF